MKATYLASAVLLLSYGPAFSDPACENEQAQVTSTATRYTNAFNELSLESQREQDAFEPGGDQASDGGIEADFDVSWADVELIFDTPTVTVEQQKLIFGLPQVTMRTRDISFGTPSMVMKRMKTGQYPEFFCDTNTVIPKCTVKWSDTYADIPQPFMEQQHIKLDVPEFTLSDVTVIMGVPEFSMQRQRWVLGLPQFTLKSLKGKVNISADSDETADESAIKPSGDIATLQSRINRAKAQQIADLSFVSHSLFDCFRGSISNQTNSVGFQYKTSIDQLNSVISSISASGGDPTQLRNPDGTVSNLLDQRDALVNAQNKALSTLGDALESLNVSERNGSAKLN
ncbi:hypothetical protein [Rhizobium leguminosarum]|uniref:Uncharacterized protein n=1 Tax=Rhizobium leguminosarum TaxID=384 RepID=A0A7M3DQN0_RHILE|nr:hypothetical protein [Rhizobium leguminosarum]TAY50939.1 hypothetical protein ELH90_04060 [Rhizobium leguminosarum]